MIDRDIISAGYRSLLRRDPESEGVISLHRSASSVEEFLSTLVASPEFHSQRSIGDRLWHYTSTFDVPALIKRFEDPQRRPSLGHRVNFLGVKTRPSVYFPTLGLAEEVEPLPIPGNWHADMAEFGAALRAVELARDQFTMIELGCGWGCWMNITGVAARRMGKHPYLIGIEGDQGHIEFAEECLGINGFCKDQYALHYGIAAAKSGTALFPLQKQSGVAWGLEPIFGATDEQRATMVASGKFAAVPMIGIDELIADRHVDLLHIDIQGGERALVKESLPLLTERVAYMVIGTHSRAIDGDIVETMESSDWTLEVERPAICSISDGRLQIVVDGVLAYRNNLLT